MTYDEPYRISQLADCRAGSTFDRSSFRIGTEKSAGLETKSWMLARLPGLICSSLISVGTEIEFATSCGTDNDIRARRQTWLSVKLQKKETLPARQLERSIRLH